jgi:hypothetical protein
VSRGTRPKKPSSSRGFARKACGARGFQGFWGLKTKNQKLKIENCKSLSKPETTTKKIFKTIFILFLFLFIASARTQPYVRVDAGTAGEGGRGGGADAKMLPSKRSMSALTRVRVLAEASVLP